MSRRRVEQLGSDLAGLRIALTRREGLIRALTVRAEAAEKALARVEALTALLSAPLCAKCGETLKAQEVNGALEVSACPTCAAARDAELDRLTAAVRARDEWIAQQCDMIHHSQAGAAGDHVCGTCEDRLRCPTITHPVKP